MVGNRGRTAQVRIEVLGPLRLRVDGRVVDVPGRRRRAVLALLARAEGRVVAVDHLVDAVWPTGPPASARAALYSHISRLRRHLGAAASRVETVGGGYRLILDEGALDVARARGLLARARPLAEQDPSGACALLRKARALWRGDPLPDLTDVAAIAAWTVTLHELGQELDDLLVDCSLRAGRADEALGVARQAAAAAPLREPAVHGLMRALAAAGRAADALGAGYAYRRRLREETGLDPSAELGRLEREIAASPPPDRAPPRVASGAGSPPTRLVGRRSELATLHRLIAGERLVTVVGPAGVGKTRVALEVARDATHATVLMLAPVTDPAGIPPALAAALGLRAARGDLLSACITLLRGGPHLLLIDNCEHLLDAVRSTVSTLLGGCSELTVLATSREPLRAPGEVACRLDPLALPEADATVGLERVPSVELFFDRARRARLVMDPRPEDLCAVADIVRRLDGLPLAIELAAGRVSALGLEDLHSRLHRALDLLDDPAAADQPRHRTLRATIDWSYALLPDDEQRLFRHLSVFPDGFDLATAERVAADIDVGGDPAAALAHLVDASMVDAHLDEPARYRMLETLRAFALDRLLANGEDMQATERLVRWAGDLAAWIQTTAVTDAEADADRVLRREVGNLRAAWYAAHHRGALDDAIIVVSRLADASTWRDLPEVWSWAQQVADDPALPTHPRAAAALGAAALTAWLQGDTARSERLARAGLDAMADDADRARCLTALAEVALFRSDTAAAVEHAVRAAACAPWPNESYGIAALAVTYAGDVAQARALLHRLDAVACYPSLRAFAAYVAGEVDAAVGRIDDAERHYTRAMDEARSSGATFVEGIAAVGLMTVRADAGRVADALRGYRDLLGYWQRTGSWIQLWTTLRNLAGLLHRLGDHEAAWFIAVAADHAPDAPAVTDAARQAAPHLALELPHTAAARIEAEAASCSRLRVLEVAREAVEGRLAATVG